MIKKIRNSRASKIIVYYLALMMIFQVVAPFQAYALTEGPSQPEFNSFTPIGTSDMVNLTSGDFNYNIPVMDVGGYPLNLSYDSGITMDQEASWVGLGWNLNVGQVNRDVRGIPDDFDGDEIQYENNLKKNKTVGMVFNINPQLAGVEAANFGMNAGLTVEYNNYEGISFKPSYGFSFELANNVQVGMSLSSSATEGVSVSPNASFSTRKTDNDDKSVNALSSKSSIGLGYNSRQGLTSFSLSSSRNISSKGFGVAGHGDVSYVTNTFTPTKRVGFKNTNFMFAFSAGPDFWSIDAEAGITAYGSFQEIRDKNVTEKAYGYENTHKASEKDILDFNRENDRPVSKNTMVLPMVNYTNDMYSIQSQGLSGTFRAFRGQAGYVYDQSVNDDGSSESLGGEVEGGTGFHVGGDVKHAPSESHTGVWNTMATQYFKQETSNKLDYEPVYFKSIGELRVDTDSGLFTTSLGGYDPIALRINGGGLGKYAGNRFRKQTYNLSGTPFVSSTDINITGKLKRANRDLRNQVIQKITKADAGKYGFNNIIKVNNNAKDHHTAAIKVLNTDGTTHIFGETAYNLTKREATFAVNGQGNCKTGKVPYSGNENSIGNSSSVDNYFNRVTTPAYAHTYLLSAILSTDYEDLTGNGLSSDDLGSFTKFKYVNKNNSYQWRTPYSEASYNAGLNSHPKDQRGSYVYGSKELKYIQTIETKTHVAYFKLSERRDGLGSAGENGGIGSGKMFKLDKIYLFSRPEYEQFRNKLENSDSSDDPTHAQMAKSCIKVAHFTYRADNDINKQLCRNIENTTQSGGGKLTLHKVHFTYRDSNMGQYTPYVFNYDSFNPDYHVKSYDFWGNYKPLAAGVIVRNSGAVQYSQVPDNTKPYSNINPIPNINSAYLNGNDITCNVASPITTPEFPFVQQDDKMLQDAYASAWTLTSIDLPSGGRIELSYETDDYQYVQDRKAMQMFTVTGAGDIPNPSSSKLVNNLLYNIDGNNEAKYLYVQIANGIDAGTFKQKYIGDNLNKPIYFNFMLNMTKQGGTSGGGNEFDYVSGYFNIDTGRAFETFISGTLNYVAIPMKHINMEGGVNGNNNVNPISKAGWYFGRTNLNRLVYGLDMTPGEDIESMARALHSSVNSVSEIFRGPNGRLRDFSIARRFIPAKSWIRLQHPGNKLGGGARVKKVVMLDNWNNMLGVNDASPLKERYANAYGQEYSYKLEDGISSSGVATYEPMGNKENPFVEPFYDKAERLVAPREVNYVERPFGESFFPSPAITYSRVTVKNITPNERTVANNVYEIKKHASGTVVSEFYTSKDFPTRAVNTELDGPQNYYSNEGDFAGEFMKSLVGAKITTQTELTLAQGFVVHTNDMNGKEKSQQVFNSAGAPISRTESVYSTDSSNPTRLNNTLPVINMDLLKGVTNKELGVQYDVVTDFRESYSKSQMFGTQGNVAGFVVGIFPIIIPMAVPERAQHTSTLHTTTTTKVIHTTGILKEKIVYDLGSRVSTKNLAWDEKTGQVLLTETINEYDDKYYNISFPAYWAYKGMDMASENIDLTGSLSPLNGSTTYWKLDNMNSTETIDKYLKLGDELFMDNGIRLWVVQYDSTKKGVRLMNRLGNTISGTGYKFRVYRSGNRNMQDATMTSVTLMRNPIEDGTLHDNTDFDVSNASPVATNRRIMNASAVEFSELWAIQCENNLPNYKLKTNTDGSLVYDNTLRFNPYVYNLLGDWRAVKSYANLTGRMSASGDSSPRNEGFFRDFSLFYAFNPSTKAWYKDTSGNWAAASEISQYSPFGPELENKDALGRYSAAQYGYSYKLPVAVASNTKYSEIGFDGFEDYDLLNGYNPHFAFSDVLNQNVWISGNASHTGKKSIAIQPGKKATLVKKINGCKPTP